jgi:hypothetical protein
LHAIIEHGLQRDERRLAIREHEGDLGRGETPVERHEDRARAHACEMKHQHLRGIARQNRYALAVRRAQGSAQHAGGAVDGVIELGVGEAGVRCQVVNRDFGRRRPGEMRNEVE